MGPAQQVSSHMVHAEPVASVRRFQDAASVECPGVMRGDDLRGKGDYESGYQDKESGSPQRFRASKTQYL
jgi:hypothetical protein